VFHLLEKRLQEAVAAHLAASCQYAGAVAVGAPAQPEFGELGTAVAFQLARQWKKPPRAIAQELAAGIGPIEGVAALEPAGNGYLNVRFERGYYGRKALEGAGGVPAGARAEKIVVEHTNINPNKAAHIGHLRNAVLGDTFVRMLRARGHQVEVQNYIDNTGVQVADVVAGFHFLERKTLDQVAELAAGERFDYLCWDLYARTSSYFKEHPPALAWRAETLHAVESGRGALAGMAHLVADAIVHAHIKTMWRLGIVYDVLPRESEILHLKFWAAAFDLLRDRKAIHLETEGKNSGCWVMPASSFSDDSADEDSKVIVRSNGIVTYVGKDIAYQLWKFGLLGKDFFYRVWSVYPDGKELWVSTGEPQPAGAHAFGAAARVYNVIDSRQSYLQNVVVAGLRALGYTEQAERSVHFSYEMVALTPRTCVELGIQLSEEDQKRSYVEVSGRKGLGVDSRHPEAPAGERLQVAAQIAIGALRYFMLKFTRNTVIAFDFQEALSFEGETGPYVQYAAVRARNILRKFEERGRKLPDFAAILDEDAMRRQLASEDFWQLLVAASKADAAIEWALASGEPAHVAKFAFTLAQSFNNFYHAYPVIHEENPERRAFLLWMTGYFRTQLERTLAVLGIHPPPYM
jgi:arginyl-tRNA synthetase